MTLKINKISKAGFVPIELIIIKCKDFQITHENTIEDYLYIYDEKDRRSYVFSMKDILDMKIEYENE